MTLFFCFFFKYHVTSSSKCDFEWDFFQEFFHEVLLRTSCVGDFYNVFWYGKQKYTFWYRKNTHNPTLFHGRKKIVMRENDQIFIWANTSKAADGQKYWRKPHLLNLLHFSPSPPSLSLRAEEALRRHSVSVCTYKAVLSLFVIYFPLHALKTLVSALNLA